mmetsp:Transcript_50965/g.135947  ORF Transcript_50965/g.135947 Transcript_50965/m.135947 type:complete len:274 (-) Transcript_50965:1886-2707(-)
MDTRGVLLSLVSELEEGALEDDPVQQSTTNSCPHNDLEKRIYPQELQGEPHQRGEQLTSMWQSLVVPTSFDHSAASLFASACRWPWPSRRLPLPAYSVILHVATAPLHVSQDPAAERRPPLVLPVWAKQPRPRHRDPSRASRAATWSSKPVPEQHMPAGAWPLPGSVPFLGVHAFALASLAAAAAPHHSQAPGLATETRLNLRALDGEDLEPTRPAEWISLHFLHQPKANLTHGARDLRRPRGSECAHQAPFSRSSYPKGSPRTKLVGRRRSG